jgi:thiamine-phosphate pyrophosphorylase
MSLSPKSADGPRCRLPCVRLCLLITRSLCVKPPLVVLEAALEEGVEMIQIREKEGQDAELLAWIREVRRRTRSTGAILIVNDRPDLALLAEADGVHLGQDDLPPLEVRRLVGPELLIGLSTHGAAEVVRSRSSPVDYLGLGPLCDTPTKGLSGRGPELLRECLQLASVPVLGIGGITPASLPPLLAAGLDRIAVSAAVLTAKDPAAAVRSLRALLQGR